MTEESDKADGELVSLFTELDAACVLAAEGVAAPAPPAIVGPPADDEEALEAALPLRLCAFEKLRGLGC